MKEEIRRAVIITVWSKATGQQASSIYSCELGKHFPMSLDYDFTTERRITQVDGGFFFDGFSNKVQITIVAGRFSGFDQNSGSQFVGTLYENTLQIYDYKLRRRYTYTVTPSTEAD